MTTDAVFAELAGLRALARSLVHGEADADDLLQDTALAALEHPPIIDERPVGGWLRAIVRNRWRMDRRGEARRRARELAAAGLTVGEDAPAALDRARDLERLAQALVALDEPFRTVVVRRFIDGQSSAQIAQDLGIPAGTVRWRLKTALARLRAQLDGAAMAAPNAEPARPTRWQRMLAPLIGVSLKSKTVAVVVIVLVLLFGVIALWRLQGGDPPPPPVLTAQPATPVVHGPAPPVPASPAGSVVAAPQEQRPRVERSAAPGGVLAGRVVHGLTRESVAGAEVTFLGSAGAVTLLTDEQGEFALAPPTPGSFVLASVTAPGFLPYAAAPDLAPVRATLASGHDVRGVRLILWPAIDYQGTVVDAHGSPAAGARVRLIGAVNNEHLPDGVVSEWTADRDGHFTFQAAPLALLEATRGTSVGRARFTLPLIEQKRLTIGLRDDGWMNHAITGHVRTRTGAPVGGAQVAAAPDPPWLNQAMSYATSADDGSFTLDSLDAGGYLLSAEDAGRARATVPQVRGGTANVTITVDPGVEIAGRVVDPTGAPVPMFSLTLSPPDRLNDVAVARSLVDPDGRFALRVAPGDYTLLVAAVGWAPPGPIAVTGGTTGVTVTMQVGSTLRGVVVASDTHAPIARARVRRGGVSGGSSVQPYNAGAVTAADGSFELTGIPAGPVVVQLDADGYHLRAEPTTRAVDGGALGPITFELTPIADGEYKEIERVGVGVTLENDAGYPKVARLVPGGSAETAGVRVGDHILAIDGVSVVEADLRSVVDKITGPLGTTVALSIVREGRTTEVSIARRAFRVSSVHAS